MELPEASIPNESFRSEIQALGYSMDDLHVWSWILNASSSDEVAERYLHSNAFSVQPSFLLLEVLRRTDLSARTFKLLVIHSWDRLMGRVTGDLLSISNSDVEKEIVIRGDNPILPLMAKKVRRAAAFEITTFITLICRLLRHARRSWPAAVISISNMLPIYVSQLSSTNLHSTDFLEKKMHHQVCSMYNTILCRLSLPSAASPLRNMGHNWEAQRVLLTSANKYRPHLIIDQASYRAVSRVLAALKKNEKEEKYVKLQQRSWPPWRRVLDGMDVQRSLGDDLSRVTHAIRRMKEAGYSEGTPDRIIRLISGRDADGTPTVQTRALLNPPGRGLLNLVGPRPEVTHEWAARIKATRDVQEAWAAFTGLPPGIKPSSQMYVAMFEKLIYDEMRSGRIHDSDASPGDGKEVLSVEDSNISEDEKLRMKPPSVEELYERMMRQGIKPAGQCLNFLIAHARTFESGAKYLEDSPKDQAAFQILLGRQNSKSDHGRRRLRTISEQTFLAFIKILCRLAYRVPISPRDHASSSATPSTPTPKYRVPASTPILGASVRSNPLLHALELLKSYGTLSRPVWYSLFTALARRDVVISRELFDNPENDILAWQVLEAALDDAYAAGLELDGKGFQIICTGCEKALLAMRHLPQNKAMLRRSVQNIKTIFAALTDNDDTGNQSKEYQLPQHLYSIEGSHLHAYVRILGLLGDTKEILSVARWMADNQGQLELVALTARNGRKLLHRVLVAMRVFLERDDSSEAEMDELRDCLTKMEVWGGWPSDEDTEEYLTNGHQDE
ncbi:MAG: hypothetical protein M1818_003071 [Claussenomyces sp. TS43310]|nr:MAG: hypothetical protein M1818_003071 [Claussenomyces sp. TS43310]